MEGEDVDFYTILNVSPNASEEEIRVAFKRLCVVFHPDKHAAASDRKAAETAFQRVRAAYNVLSNPENRALYDVFGKKALEMKMELVPSTKHIKELKEEYEKIWLKEKELKKLRELAPSTNLRIGFDTSSQTGISKSEIENPSMLTQVSLSQSKQYRIAESFNLATSASATSQNGVGIANFALTLRKVLSDRIVLSTSFNLNNLLFHPLDNRPRAAPSCIYCSNPLEPDERLAYTGIVMNIPKLRPSFSALALALEHQLSASLSQIIELGGISPTQILPTEVGYSLMYKSPPFQVAGGFLIGKFEKTCNMQLRYSFSQYELRGACRLSTLQPIAMTYGAMRFSQDGMSVSGFELNVSSQLISIIIRLYVGKRKFTVPVTLSQSFCWPTLFYSTLAPVVLGLAWNRVFSRPFAWLKSKIEFGYDHEQQVKKNMQSEEVVEKRRRGAEKETSLMKAQCTRIANEERKKNDFYGIELANISAPPRMSFEGNPSNGLVIQRAWYGQLEESQEHPNLSSVCYSVATQLQICVVNSKLILNQGQPKSQLAGFYDPCPGNEKKLKIVYLFKGELHEATFADLDPVRLPKMSHRVENS